MNITIARKVLDTIKEYNKIIIFRHFRPDGDAISSSIAMYEFLVSLGKNPEDIDVFAEVLHAVINEAATE
jgi:nanoRNase/pAp phosphatase (c-di-AMP/oligoRNAs hydrolase)